MDPSQPPNQNNGASSSSNDTPRYEPQFSAATEMILKRINSGASTGSLGPIGNTGLLPGYDDMRRAVMNSMKTSMNMELPPVQAPSRRNQGERASVGSGSSANAGKSTPRGTPKPRGKANNGTPATGGRGRGGAKGSARGKKRKRAKDESEEEESSSESDQMSDLGDDSDSGDEASIPEDNFPKVTQSGRAIVRPTHFVPTVSDTPPKKRAARKSQKSVENALCKRCGRGHSPANNQMTFCDGCQLGWHQMCHDPVIKDEYVKDIDTPWFCADCTEKRAPKLEAPVVEQQILASVPVSAPPMINEPPEPPKLVSWQGSDAEKYAYLNTLRQPQLVNLVFQATSIHPDLPIFPASIRSQKPPMHAYAAPQPNHPVHPSSFSNANASNTFTRHTASFHSHPSPLPPTAQTGGLFNRAEANPNGTMNFIRKIPPGQHATPPPPTYGFAQAMPPPSFAKTSSTQPATSQQSGFGAIVMEGVDSRESTPASPPYPKAGNGLMSKLGPDDEDIDWLEDANDAFAFSGTVYDPPFLGH